MECPICKSKVQELERGLFDGYALRCPVHSEIDFSDTVRATRMNEPREAWERAHSNARLRAIKDAQHKNVGGKRPRIIDEDFEPFAG
ncbi:hypothetical protein ACVWXO_000093 [Bradyrhizobium sp. LM2.7]